MKRCPECIRDYHDDTLVFCLDDGERLVEGPRSNIKKSIALPGPTDETPTLRLPKQEKEAVPALVPRSASTSGLLWLASVLLATIGGGFVAYRHLSVPELPAAAAIEAPPRSQKLYWEMTEAEQFAFIKDRAILVQKLIGDEPTELEDAAVLAIKVEVDDYVEDRDSLSQRPLEEGLRVIYGRATQFAPVIIRAFEEHKVPPALGLYQAMIESEYHDCLENHGHPRGPVGLFQFSRRTAAQYGMEPTDYCDVRKQCDAAARHMSDLISDFGTEKSSWTLALLSFHEGANGVRETLRETRASGVTERSFWAIFRYRSRVRSTITGEPNTYVPRFFAAAIIGETPRAFDLATPPLTTLRE